jgi:hypothetical protein
MRAQDELQALHEAISHALRQTPVRPSRSLPEPAAPHAGTQAGTTHPPGVAAAVCPARRADMNQTTRSAARRRAWGQWRHLPRLRPLQLPARGQPLRHACGWEWDGQFEPSGAGEAFASAWSTLAALAFGVEEDSTPTKHPCCAPCPARPHARGPHRAGRARRAARAGARAPRRRPHPAVAGQRAG